MTADDDIWVILLPMAVAGIGLYLMAVVFSSGNPLPVSIHTDGSLAVTGRKLNVQFIVDRRRDCPGIVVHAFSQLGTEKSTSQVVVSYPAIETAVGIYKRNMTIDVPPLVAPGRWRYSMTLDSDCNGQRVIDRVVSGDIDVMAK